MDDGRKDEVEGGGIKRGMEGERAGYSDQSVPKTGRDMKNDK